MDIVIEYKDKKNSSATMRNGKLILRISNRLSKKHQQEHIDKLLNRFKKHQIEHEHTLLKDGESFNFYGLKTVTLSLQETNSNRTTIKLNEHQLIVTKPEHLPQLDLKKKITKRITTLLEPKLINYVKTINNNTINQKIHGIDFKNFKSRWGHCNYKDKTITLSTKLAWVPKAHFEYVIIHELCHLIHPNHSQTYWQLVAQHCPNYNQLRKALIKWQ